MKKLIKTKMLDAICGICMLVGFGGLGGACDTGKGFVLSMIILAIGFVAGKLNYC